MGSNKNANSNYLFYSQCPLGYLETAADSRDGIPT